MIPEGLLAAVKYQEERMEFFKQRHERAKIEDPGSEWATYPWESCVDWHSVAVAYLAVAVYKLIEKK